MVEARLVERPTAHRPGVDMDKPRMRVPPDAAPLHCTGCIHCFTELRSEAHIERAAVDVLAVLGHPEGGAREHRVGFGRTIGGKDCRVGLTDRIENIGEKIDHFDIHLDLLSGMMVAKKDGQLFHQPVDRTAVVAVGAFEGLARMAVDEAEAAGSRRPRNRAGTRWPRRQSSAKKEKAAPIHRPRPRFKVRTVSAGARCNRARSRGGSARRRGAAARPGSPEPFAADSDLGSSHPPDRRYRYSTSADRADRARPD